MRSTPKSQIQSSAARNQADSAGASMKWGPGVPEKQLAHPTTGWPVHLPPVVDDELRRLPPADRGEPENRQTALPGRHRITCDLQPAGRPRGHVQLGRHSTVKNNVIAPISALVISSTNISRRERIYAQQRRVGRRLFRVRRFAALSAPTAHRDQDLHRLPCRSQRQQRSGAAAAARDQLRQFCRANAWVGEEGDIEA